MLSGVPIDGQRETRSRGRTEIEAKQEAQSSSVAGDGARISVDSDDEEDPNDYIPRPEVQRSEAQATEINYDFDVSDYGSDSD